MEMNVFKQDIPKSFHKDLVFATFLMINRQKSVLFLSKNCTLYEIQSLKLLYTINLKDSFKDVILNQVEKNSELPFNAPFIESEKNNIFMGKYILNHGVSSRFFILLRIGEKLVILERKESGYNLIREFRNVDKIEIIDPDNLYQANIYILHIGDINPTKICLDDDSVTTENQTIAYLAEDYRVKKLFETVNKARTDLADEIEETKKMFLSTKNLATFGCNLIRSHEIEEKMILSRCGDIWMKIHNEFLVIGIPVSNNCSERLTTLQNIRPIINFNNQSGIEFQCTIYEMSKRELNINLDSAESNENFDDIFNFHGEWIPAKTRSLLPDSVAIISITLSLNNFYNLSSNEIICFIAYDIYHENQTFTQNLFVKKLQIDSEILYNSKFELQSKIDSAINFITIAETSTQYTFIINVPVESKINFLCNFTMIFMELLLFEKFEESNEAMDMDNDESLKQLYAEDEKTTEDENSIEKLLFREYADSTDSIEIDMNKKLNNNKSEESERTKFKIFYKLDHKCGDFWYGTVIILSELPENKFKMKIYSRSESKIIALIQLIYKNSTEKIKIFPANCISNEECVQNLENALCEEINLKVEITKDHQNEKKISNKNYLGLKQKLFAKELQTDDSLNQLKGNLNIF